MMFFEDPEHSSPEESPKAVADAPQEEEKLNEASAGHEDTAEEKTAAALDAEVDWYIVQVQSGFERKVIEGIRNQAQFKGLDGLIHDVNAPSEEIVEFKRGVRKKSEHKLFPGYLMMQADMNDEVRNMILQIPKVINILGGGKGEAAPVSGDEVSRINDQLQEGAGRNKPAIVFEIGEQVRVSDGPFASFTGMVESVDEERARLKVSISIFGRATPVSLDYTQVEKT